MHIPNTAIRARGQCLANTNAIAASVEPTPPAATIHPRPLRDAP